MGAYKLQTICVTIKLHEMLHRGGAQAFNTYQHAVDIPKDVFHLIGKAGWVVVGNDKASRHTKFLEPLKFSGCMVNMHQAAGLEEILVFFDHRMKDPGIPIHFL